MSENRRFNGLNRLYGEAFSPQSLHAIVIGVGGVGSWVAEGLGRSGVGRITLVDMDIIAESNINRQLPAMTSTLGESKIEVMAGRLQDINPAVVVELVDDFLTADNVATILPSLNKSPNENRENDIKTVVIDCTDDMNAKLAIALHCRFNKLKLIVCGGAGGKIDPTALTVSDLRDVYQDPLLAKLRSRLRERGIGRTAKGKFGIKCVYSGEPPKVAKACEGGLQCGGYGSSVAMTCAMAMVVVAQVLALV